MNPKYTQCPSCKTIYTVGVTQLTIAHGMVNCPRCETDFSALSHLVELGTAKNWTAHNNFSLDNEHLADQPTQRELAIFTAKVEQSNLNLRSYLNSLGVHNPLNAAQSDTLQVPELMLSKDQKHSHWRYYVLWGAVNIVLMLLLLLQIAWFNPNILHESAVLMRLFQHLCAGVDCPYSLP